MSCYCHNGVFMGRGASLKHGGQRGGDRPSFDMEVIGGREPTAKRSIGRSAEVFSYKSEAVFSSSLANVEIQVDEDKPALSSL